MDSGILVAHSPHSVAGAAGDFAYYRNTPFPFQPPIGAPNPFTLAGTPALVKADSGAVRADCDLVGQGRACPSVVFTARLQVDHR